MTTEPTTIDLTFSGPLTNSDDIGGWVFLILPNSREIFGTGKPIKVAGTVESVEFQATLMPLGGGTHMMPFKAALRKAIGKDLGDEVTVHFQQRLN